MKRDLDLLREILLHVEAQGDVPVFSAEIALEGYDHAQIAYHAWLALDAGFVDGSDASDTGGRDVLIQALTFAGHDYLDAVRAPKVWEGVKSRAADAGVALTVDMAKALAKHIAGEYLGLRL